ncbi:MAG TPA: DapH/DapD/GlmU-related protein [Bacteriovoracaceae bacterium]|nr:DapH/DapD/GlmU-related protein [Bacteriovoracaceae bacterium]
MKRLSKYQNFIFDKLFWIFTYVVYGTSLGVTLAFARYFWTDVLYQQVIIILLSYFIFIHAFVLTIGICKRIFQRKLVVGKIPVGLNKDYLAFALNSVFHGIFFTSPVAGQVGIIFYLTALYYRLMGMKIGISNIIGTGTLIRQPELISLGEKTVIGIGSILSCHYSPNGKTHVQGKITVGKHSLIGAYSQLAPDTTVGDNVVIGNRSIIFSDVRIGNNVKIGMGCRIEYGVTIPDNVTIKSYSVIKRSDQIKSGETWGGSPAELLRKGDNDE